MITINDKILKKQDKFYSGAVFHPTDAIEDAWGKRILDRIASDGAVKTMRIYTMFEDIVYLGENGELCYDFRLSDLRLDYMVEKGYDLLLAYAGMPDCIAESSEFKISMSKNKTRYKNKMWNSSIPKDYKLWEEICYQYTKHNIERYGIEVVSKWRCHCFNEPDTSNFWLSNLPKELETTMEYRLPEYCKLYKAFVKGVTRASDKIKVGGPALAWRRQFLGGFLDFIKESGTRLDFITMHEYGTSPKSLNEKLMKIDVQNSIDKHQGLVEVIEEKGFIGTPVIVDEWGLSSSGFKNFEDCPDLLVREHEVFSCYFAKLIHRLVYSTYKIDGFYICLSGQHEMVRDFTGFRNFFTLNFFAKPIYNAFYLTSKLKENLLDGVENDNLFIMPTKDDSGNYALLLSYSNDNFEKIKDRKETITFSEDLSNKKCTIWCIDKFTTNPYRVFEKMGSPEDLTKEQIDLLREEGNIKPIKELVLTKNEIELTFTSNSTYLVTIE
jgi:xylan 1,4-beta-xylosidase